MLFSAGSMLWEAAKDAVKKLFSRSPADDSIKFENYRRMNQQIDDQFTKPSSIKNTEPLKTDGYLSKIDSTGSVTLGEPTTSSLLDAIKDSSKVQIEALNDAYSNLSGKLDSIDSRIDIVNQNIQASIQATQSYGVSNIEASRQIGTKKSLLGSIWSAVTSLPGKILTAIGTAGYLGYKAVDALSDYAAKVKTQTTLPLPENAATLTALQENQKYQGLLEKEKPLNERIAAYREEGVKSSEELRTSNKPVSKINDLISTGLSSLTGKASKTIAGWLKSPYIEDEERKALRTLIGEEANSDTLKSSDTNVKLALLNALKFANNHPLLSLENVILKANDKGLYNDKIAGSDEWSYSSYNQTSELDELLKSVKTISALKNSIEVEEGVKNTNVESIEPSKMINDKFDAMNKAMFGPKWTSDTGFQVDEKTGIAMLEYLEKNPGDGIKHLMKNAYSNYDPASGKGELKVTEYLDLYSTYYNVTEVADIYEGYHDLAPTAWKYFQIARDRVNADLIALWKNSLGASGRSAEDYGIKLTGDNIKDAEELAKLIERGIKKYKNKNQTITTEQNYQGLLDLSDRLSNDTSSADLVGQYVFNKGVKIEHIRDSIADSPHPDIKSASDLNKVFDIELSDGTKITNNDDVAGILNLMLVDDTLTLEEAVAKYKSKDSPNYLTNLALNGVSEKGFKLKKISGSPNSEPIILDDAAVTDFSEYTNLYNLSRHVDLVSSDGTEITDNNKVLKMLQNMSSEDIISKALALSIASTVTENKSILERITSWLNGPSQQVKSIDESE